MPHEAIVHGLKHSFMDFDLRQVKGVVHPEVLQEIMTIRREANFYDIAPGIVMQAIGIAKARDFDPPDHYMPPSRQGYMRLSFEDGLGFEDADKGVRINGLLWKDDYWYLIHETGAENVVRFIPFRVQINVAYSPDIDLRQFEAMTYDGADVPAHKRVRILPVSDAGTKSMLELCRGGIEEMVCLARIIFDMISETRATTLIRSTHQMHFASKQRQYYECTSVVKINLSRCRTRYLREAHEPTGRHNAWHQPRDHFAHWRVTNPDCQHEWVSRYGVDDGKHYKCDKCHEIKTRRSFPNGRGDPNKGRVHTVYEVTE